LRFANISQKLSFKNFRLINNATCKHDVKRKAEEEVIKIVAESKKPP